MIIDHLQQSARYNELYKGISQAFDYIANTDLQSVLPGKYEIDADNIFAIVQEYETLEAANEQMEAHRKYIDVQYMISGEERVGHAFLSSQKLSKEYSEEEDFLLVPDVPDFFTHFKAGMFMIFFPTDLHMPCIKIGNTGKVKKVVVKVKV